MLDDAGYRVGTWWASWAGVMIVLLFPLVVVFARLFGGLIEDCVEERLEEERRKAMGFGTEYE